MAEVYMTGLLPLEAGLPHSDLAHLWTLNPLRQAGMCGAEHFPAGRDDDENPRGGAEKHITQLSQQICQLFPPQRHNLWV